MRQNLVVGLIFAITWALCAEYAKSARILGVFPLAARSHYILGNALLKGLANVGHDVTMVSPFEEKDLPENGTYRNVILTGFIKQQDDQFKHTNLFDTEGISLYLTEIMMARSLSVISDKVYGHPNTQKLLSSNEHFDIVIVEDFFAEALYALANHYKAPLILFATVGANLWSNPKAGNPNPLSYIPNVFTSYSSNMTFFQRLDNAMLTLFSDAIRYLYLFPVQANVIKKHFPASPDLDAIIYNASIVFLNSHPSTNQAVPHVPNLIEIGGLHVQPAKKLPKDLQDFMDSAKDGVIYFSMGSFLKSKNLHAGKREALLTTFSKLKQKVLWKWEDDELPGKPANVRAAKWLPQQDILAHPNLKLFITHGGLLSSTEAVYHGVPLLAIPIAGDQKMNARLAHSNGIGLYVPYRELSEEKLTAGIQEILTNPRYREAAKKRSAIFHDRTVKPLDEAVYWVEYVLRHGGAPHLRVAGVDLPWYEYHLIDVIGFISFIALASLLITLILVRRLLRRCCSKKSSDKKAKQN